MDIFLYDCKTRVFQIPLLQISLALTPPILLLASWLTNKQNYPGKVILIVAMSSSLLMVLFCSFEDEYAHYKMLFHHGLLGLMMSGSLSFFIVYAKRYVAKVCIFIVVLLKKVMVLYWREVPVFQLSNIRLQLFKLGVHVMPSIQ